MYQLSTTIKELRAKHSLTQEELAARVGVARQTITYLERGEYMPSLLLAWKIAQEFNTSLESVFSISE